MKLKRIVFIVLLAFCFCKAYSQSGQERVFQYKDSLNHLARNMQRGENDSVRTASQTVYYSILNFLLTDSSSFNASFDSVPNLSVKASPDKAFRLYTWVAANYEGSVYRYHGFIQTQNQRTKKTTLIPLADSTEVIEKPLNKKLKPDHWYGAVYYSIILQIRSGKKFYTLLGWKGKDQALTQKVMDVLSFDNGKPLFGLPVFEAKNVLYHRVIFEFTAQATMSLKFVSEKKTIVFDHIGRSTLTGIVGPEGTYDAFKFDKDHWELSEDVDVDNGFTPKKKEVRLFKDEELKK